METELKKKINREKNENNKRRKDKEDKGTNQEFNISTNKGQGRGEEGSEGGGRGIQEYECDIGKVEKADNMERVEVIEQAEFSGLKR